MCISDEYKRGIAPGETGLDYNDRARRILHEAKTLSVDVSGGYANLNQWMALAKSKGMTWTEGLYFSRDRMREKQPTGEA